MSFEVVAHCPKVLQEHFNTPLTLSLLPPSDGNHNSAISTLINTFAVDICGPHMMNPNVLVTP